nr:putative ribonuclease H-like domain-containing protein [Tanacetum cinerariifolium]
MEIKKFLKAVRTQILLLVQKSPLMTHLSLLQAQQWKLKFPPWGGSNFPEPLSLGNVMSFEKRLEDFFEDTSDASTPTLRIHKDHPKSKITGPIDTPVQTRQKTINVDEQSFIATINQKTNLDLLHYYVEFPHRVYTVEKAMYGLHQAPRDWYGTLSKYLLDNGFQRDTDIRTARTPMDRKNPWEKDVAGKDVELHLHEVTPKEYHLYAVKRMFRYLKGPPKLGLWYPKESPFDLVAYSDSDYGGAN